MLKSSVTIGVIIATLVLPTTIPVFASEDKPEQTQTYVKGERERESGFYREDGYPIDTKLRPAINPDFAPDESCDLKWELKCIPGSEQQCRDLGYRNGEMNVCTPIGCPDGYHDNFEWEDQVCYSNEIDCPDDMMLIEDKYGTTCSPLFLTSSVSATSLDETDIPNKYRDIPALRECWNGGYDAGKQGEYDIDRALECTRLIEEGTPYREAAQKGCMDGGYPEEDCLEIYH